MKLHDQLADNSGRGFTVIEVVVVLGILGIIFAIGLPVSWNFYLDYQLDSEHELLKSVLRQAENFSFINHNESAHGVYLDAANFILFQGSSFAARNQTEDRFLPRTASITITGPTELIFESLSGRTTSSTYIISNGRKTANIYVNSEGTVGD